MHTTLPRPALHAPPDRSSTSQAGALLSSEALSTLINLAGRQRMLSQRIVLQAELAAQGDTLARSRLGDGLKLMADTHRQLAHGTPELPAPFSESLKAAYFGVGQGQQRITHFLDLAQRVYNGLTAIRPGQTPPELPPLIELSSPILTLLHDITQLYESEARQLALKEKRARHTLIEEIQRVAREAKIVAFNAIVAANRAGPQGREFGVVAERMGSVTAEVDRLAQQALSGA